MGSVYGVKFANGFGPLPGDVIRQNVTNATCLATSATCNAPGTISISNITCSSALLSWTSNSSATGFKVSYKKVSDVNWMSVNANSTSITLNNLTALDTFHVKISTICSDGESGTSYEYGFKTPNNPVCTVSQTPTVTNITGTTATVNWVNVPCATSYTFDIRTLPGSTWKSEKITTNEKRLTGLNAGKSYEVRVTAVCTALTGLTSTIATFTTKADPKGNDTGSNSNCPTTNAPFVGNITANSANVSWNKVAGVTAYILEYKKDNETAWVKYNTTSTSVSLSGLTGGTQYNTRVSAVCNTVSGNASGSTNFATASSSMNCDITTAPTIASYSNKSATVSWQAITGASYYTLEYKLASASKWSSQKTTGNNYTLRNLKSQQNYQVRVTAVCNSVKGTPSPITSFTMGTNALVYSNKNYTVSPNPTNGLIKLQIDSDSEGSVDISVMDATGKVIIVKPRINVYEGTQINEIDLSGLANGFYFIRISDFDNNNVEVKKVLLVRR
jgi:hypothetical protein